MNKYQYILGGLLLIFSVLSSCSTEEQMIGKVEEGNVPIQLAGALFQTTGDCGNLGSNPYDNLYLSAKVDDNGQLGVDFFKNKAFNNGLVLPPYVEGNANSAGITLQERIYYPLGGIGLRLFAHSGKIDTDGKLLLNAGQKDENDYIISNGMDGKGLGTLSSSDNSSTTLTFRHLMTKVFVDIVVDKTGTDNDFPDPEPTSIQIGFKNELAVQTANYDITSTANVTGGTGNYTLKKGINYLIPNGEVLANKQAPVYPLKSLVIDDYTTEDAILSTLALEPASGNMHEKMELVPGYAYKITFNIKKLKVTAITFKMIEWDTVVLDNENSSYIPTELKLNLGSYLQTEAVDAITKVVLHTNDVGNKQYVGNVIYKAGIPVGNFYSLPTSVQTVDLYTSQGLLIEGVEPDPNTYVDDMTTTENTTDKHITISLSKGGMKTLSGVANSQSNPYLVETPLQLMNISKDAGSNVFYRQKNDIDLASLQVSYSPINTFEGIYDGNGKRIVNASFAGDGLFASNSGTIQHMRIASGKIKTTGTHAGSICGKNNSTGVIVACVNEAQLHGSASYAGGICGENNGIIMACLNTGDLFTGSQYSGGICGENKNGGSGAIKACVNVGMMNRLSSNMGGICGTTVSGTSIMQTCYWLTGTAKKYSGNEDKVNDIEVAVNGGYTPAGADDVADLSVQKLREGHGLEESKTTINRLNDVCQSSAYDIYEFTYNVILNGCVWPMPVKK